MEKYGVEYDQEKIKTASEIPDTCPQCGDKINYYGTLVTREQPWCSKCGTKPWEKKPTKF